MVGVLEEEKEGQCGWIIKNGGEIRRTKRL